MFYLQSVLVLIFAGILYLYGSYKTLIPLFKRIVHPFNLATKITLSSVLFGYGLILFFELDSGMTYFKSYTNVSKWHIGFLLIILLTLLCFCVATVLFRMTFLFFKTFSQQNLQAELTKNNLFMAGLFSTYFIILCGLIADPLIRFIDVLINFDY